MAINLLINRIYVWVSDLRWQVLSALILLHMGLTAAGFILAGEPMLSGKADVLEEIANFAYFYGTTAATIGYGDISPQTPMGRIFAAVFLFPVALVFFTILIARATSTIGGIWRKRMNGLGDYSDLRGATVILGYHPLRTTRMIREIRAEAGVCRTIVLVSDGDVKIDHSEIRYVRTESLSAREDLLRAGVLEAATVIVYGRDDDQTLSAALAVAALNDRAHLVAHFDEQAQADLLRAHTHAVCVVSQAVEIMVREMRDPGVSVILNDLSSAQTSVALFSMALPPRAWRISDLERALRANGGVVVSWRDPDGQTLFCLPPDRTIRGGTLFYLSEARIPPETIPPGTGNP